MSDDVKNNSNLRTNFRTVMLRPDLGAIVGVILVFLFFFLVARDTGMFSLRGLNELGNSLVSIYHHCSRRLSIDDCRRI